MRTAQTCKRQVDNTFISTYGNMVSPLAQMSWLTRQVLNTTSVCPCPSPPSRSKYLVRSSYLQIYNEVVSDLLKPERAALAIREDRRRGVFVDGLSEWVVRSPAEVYQLMQRGQALVGQEG